MEVTDKVVIITGASSGIGAATAIYFSKQSAKLALVGRNEKNLKRIALYCEKTNGMKALTIAADITEEHEAERIIEETIDHFGKIDVLVNNAGITGKDGIKNDIKHNLELFDKIMATNLRAVYHLTMLAAPHLIKTQGCIVNVSCIASTRPSYMSLAYDASKAALDQLTKCVSLELAPDGVRVNSVNPGFVKTNLLKDVELSEDQLELVVQNMQNSLPLKKTVQGDDVASLIAFLASDKSKSITGCNYVVDGGKLLR